MSRRAWLWLWAVLLLGYGAARVIALPAFPSFVDEAFHINFARAVLDTGPFARSEEGRQFVVWLYILFGAPLNAPFWSARVANLIVLLPGFAAVIGAGRLLSNRWGAAFAGLLLIFSPYHHFFDRLALADPVSASAVALAIYFASRLKRRTAFADAALCGVALFLACGAKISALPYFAIPVFALIAFQRSRAGLKWAFTALAVGIGLTALYLGVLFWRGYNPFFYLQTGRSAPLIEIISTNIASTTRTLVGYFGLPAALLLLLALLGLLIRQRFFVLLCLFLPLAVLWLSPRQHSRHLVAPMTLFVLGGALAFGELVGKFPQLRGVVLGLLMAGGLILWTPFALTLATVPATLSLPADDRAEYITSEGSGFGLEEVITALQDRHPARVIGILANCLSLRDSAPFPVDCPRLAPNGEDIPALDDLLASNRAEGVYTVLEAIPYAPTSSPGTLIATIDVGRPRLSIYHLAYDLAYDSAP